MTSDAPFLLAANGATTLSYQQLLNKVNLEDCPDGSVVVDDFASLAVLIIEAAAYGRHLQLRETALGAGRAYELNIAGNAQPSRKTFDSLSSLQNAITQSGSNITIFTSGTTGEPKAVTHPLQSLLRWVRPSKNSHQQRWLFTYNPVHMAGLQVFFQVLVGGHAMVYAFEASKAWLLANMETLSITHISATPTFYRFLLPLPSPISSVERITSGGEKMESVLAEKLAIAFPNAQFNNIFATTEAGALLVARGEDFTIPDHFKGLVKIDNGELCIHESLMGQMASAAPGAWYRTGDMVVFSDPDQKHFRFTGRSTDFISTGGNRVNLQYVQDKILELSEVSLARVYARPNALLGNIICADIVPGESSLTEPMLRASLALVLLPFEMPRIVRFVKNIEMTSSGKTKR